MSDKEGYYEPPEGADLSSRSPDNENWLPIELDNELKDAAPETDDIDGVGNVTDTKKLVTAGAKLFYKGSQFYNFYQANQMPLENKVKSAGPQKEANGNAGKNLQHDFT